MIEPHVSSPPAVPPRSWGWRTALRWLLVVGALLAVGWILWQSGGALTPFILGLVLAYLMVPLVGRLARYMPRWAAILIVYLLTFGVVGLAFAYIVPPTIGQIEQLIVSIPGWYEDARVQAERLFAQFRREVSPEIQAQVDEQIANIQQTVQQNASAWAQNAATFLFSSVQRVFQTLTFLLGFLIIPFFLFYTLLDSQKLPGTINTMLHPRIRDDFWNLLRIVDTIMGKYIRGQLTLGLIIAVMSFVGLTILNLLGYEVRFTILLAIVAGIGELIPVVGPILSAIPAIIVGATDGLDTAIAVTVLYIVIQQVENQILVPRIVGNNLRLHAALLMALLVIASQIGGLLLVILSAPLTAIARDMFVYLHKRLMEPPVPAAVAIGDVLDAPTDDSLTAPKNVGKARTYPRRTTNDERRTTNDEPPMESARRKAQNAKRTAQ
jgi:predicted PurR-regulated permease PerM